MLYWDDACWFIMGSLMFAAAFVKTGVDKRVCLMMFRKLAVPNVRWITLIFFIIISRWRPLFPTMPWRPCSCPSGCSSIRTA
jgi:di/tricarboxylate transporter